MNLTELATQISGTEGGKVNLPIAQISEVIRAFGDAYYALSPDERLVMLDQMLYNAGRRARASGKKGGAVKKATKPAAKKAAAKTVKKAPAAKKKKAMKAAVKRATKPKSQARKVTKNMTPAAHAATTPAKATL